MYLTNKYTKCYNNIIAQAKSRSNNIMYGENHHIIPKSLGGNNSKTNIVLLTPKEHYICHLLLTKMLQDRESIRKMWYAHYMMMRGKRRYKPCARMYEYARQNMIKANKDRPGPNLGKQVSEETKRKLSLSTKGIPRGPFSDDHIKTCANQKLKSTRKIYLLLG